MKIKVFFVLTLLKITTMTYSMEKSLSKLDDKKQIFYGKFEAKKRGGYLGKALTVELMDFFVHGIIYKIDCKYNGKIIPSTIHNSIIFTCSNPIEIKKRKGYATIDDPDISYPYYIKIPKKTTIKNAHLFNVNKSQLNQTILDYQTSIKYQTTAVDRIDLMGIKGPLIFYKFYYKVNQENKNIIVRSKNIICVDTSKYNLRCVDPTTQELFDFGIIKNCSIFNLKILKMFFAYQCLCNNVICKLNKDVLSLIAWYMKNVFMYV